MLLIRCSGCKEKLFKYEKIGTGEVLICHKERMMKQYEAVFEDGEILCPCGQKIGTDKGTYYKMIGKAFTYSGTKSR